MGLKLSNNAISRLASGISNSDTSISLTPGSGALFPALTAGDWFPATLVKSDGSLEIVRATARSVDVLTVTRAQENTTAKAFGSGDLIELRLTAAAFQTFADETLAELAEQSSQLSALLPPGTGPIPWSLPTEPSGWIFADGRTLTSATPYTDLRQAYINAGYPFGNIGADPKIPDMRGRVAACKDDMGGTAANRLTTAGGGVNGATLGAYGGAETHTLTTEQIPSHNHTASTTTDGGHSHGGSTNTVAAHAHTASTASAGAHAHGLYAINVATGGGEYYIYIPNGPGSSMDTSSAGAHTHTVTVNAGGDHSHTITADAGHTHTVTVNSNGSGSAHPIVQPTLVTNYIIKV